MAINETLDVTPPFSLNTLQTRSETINVLISSTLIALILVNVGSVVSKVVYSQKDESFNNDAWLRSFIFANSDDPLRVLFWMLPNYKYGGRERPLVRNDLRPARLLVPLLARIVLLLFSIMSVGIGLPTERKLNGCKNGDYEIHFFAPLIVSEGDVELLTSCQRIPLQSKVGLIESTAQYCWMSKDEDVEDEFGDESLFYLLARDGNLSWYFVSNGTGHFTILFVEWFKMEAPGVLFRSTFDSVRVQELGNTAVTALTRRLSCSSEDPSIEENGFFSLLHGCHFGLNNGTSPGHVNREITTLVLDGLYLTRRDGGSRRHKVTTEDNATGVITNECPIDISLTHPLVNMVPFSFILIIVCFINLLVTYVLAKRWNAFDVAFLTVNESYRNFPSVDPLEQSNRNRFFTLHADIRKKRRKIWNCRDTDPSITGQGNADSELCFNGGFDIECDARDIAKLQLHTSDESTFLRSAAEDNEVHRQGPQTAVQEEEEPVGVSIPLQTTEMPSQIMVQNKHPLLQ